MNQNNSKMLSIPQDKNTGISVNNFKIRFWTDVNNDSCKELIEHIIELEDKLDDLSGNFPVSANDLPSIELYINSPGGTVHDALAVVDHIQASKYNFVSIIEGSAASAATIISVVCDKRKIYKNAMMLIHELSSGIRGRMSFMQDDIYCCKKLMNIINNIYMGHTKISSDSLNDVLKRDIYWSADEALEIGLVDEIININKKPKFSKNKQRYIINNNNLDKCSLKLPVKTKKRNKLIELNTIKVKKRINKKRKVN